MSQASCTQPSRWWESLSLFILALSGKVRIFLSLWLSCREFKGRCLIMTSFPSLFLFPFCAHLSSHQQNRSTIIVGKSHPHQLRCRQSEEDGDVAFSILSSLLPFSSIPSPHTDGTWWSQSRSLWNLSGPCLQNKSTIIVGRSRPHQARCRQSAEDHAEHNSPPCSCRHQENRHLQMNAKREREEESEKRQQEGRERRRVNQRRDSWTEMGG